MSRGLQYIKHVLIVFLARRDLCTVSAQFSLTLIISGGGRDKLSPVAQKIVKSACILTIIILL